jgi:Na+(H+)/acetate symporter ActP
MSGFIIYVVTAICLSIIGFSFINGIVDYNKRRSAKNYAVLISAFWFPLLIVGVFWLICNGANNNKGVNAEENGIDDSTGLKKKFSEAFN